MWDVDVVAVWDVDVVAVRDVDVRDVDVVPANILASYSRMLTQLAISMYSSSTARSLTDCWGLVVRPGD